MTMTHPVAKKILHWYDRHQRDLPWRRTKDPYAIWVSEIMLQQTQVQTVIPYYRRFLDHFPTVRSLAAASLDEVLALWENLGYYSRARHLHAAAIEIVKRWQGVLPSTEEGLRQVPGIGPYTAAAVASIAHGEAVPALDGNVKRVLCRLFGVQASLDRRRTLDRLRRLAEEMIPARQPGRFNQALMDLGAMICTPRKPACLACPVFERCRAAAEGLQDALPLKAKRSALPRKHTAAALLVDGRGRVLIVQRPHRGFLGGMWGFPGGPGQEGETLKKSLVRRVKEELGVVLRCGKELAAVNHAYSHFKMTLHVFQCSIKSGKPRALTCRAVMWAAPGELERLPCSKADRKVMEALSITAGRR